MRKGMSGYQDNILMSSAAPPILLSTVFRWKHQHFVAATLLMYNLAIADQKVVLCSFRSGWKHISQDDTISLTHLDPHMMHKVFDTDWISGSFQQSWNGLKMPPTGTLKGNCSVLIYMLAFEGQFENWFIIVHIEDKQKSLMSCKKERERKVEETRCFVQPGIFSAFVPWKYLGHPSLFKVGQNWANISLALALFTGTCLLKVRSGIETHLFRMRIYCDILSFKYVLPDARRISWFILQQAVINC